jgi:peptide/nickel transport system permease protein
MTAVEIPNTVPVAASKVSLFRRLLRRPVSVGAMIFLALLAFVTIFGTVLAPYDPNAGSLQQILAPPSAEHPLGADSAGRDVLSRLLAATQISIAAALLATVTALVIGVIAGLLAGYYRGWLDTVTSWFTSLVMALPGIVILLAARTILGPSIWLAMLVFGIILSPAYFRLVYAAVSGVRNELYVDAARVSGLSDSRIIGRHILSVVRAPIIIQSAIIAGIAIAVQSGLEFLGLGDLAVPTWGAMLNDAFVNIYQAPILMLWPALAISLTCIALTLVANGMRDVLERTATVRRRRRRLVTTRTGSISTVTTSLSLSGADSNALDEIEIVSEEPAIIHPDDEASARRTGRSILQVNDLRVAYGQGRAGSTEVVHGVSLEVRAGEVHGLVGESGSGKTQTAFAVLGVLPRGGEITGGSIVFDGQELSDGSGQAYRGIRGKRIAYIPQEPMSNLDPSFRIGFQLVQPLRETLGLSKREATAKALELLARVGIPDPKRTFRAYPFEISGGMAQRVLIAGAVSTQPDLIIADEPTTALDVTVQAEVLDLIRDLQHEQGMAVLLVTHNFGVVSDLCDRVTVMQHGSFVESGPVRSILRSPQHPYTRSLLAAILDGGPAREELVTREGNPS